MKNLIIILLLTAGIWANTIEACTRVVYQGTNGIILTARSMDWAEDTNSNLWIFPRGIERSGQIGINPIKWKAKYGSIIASAFEFATVDGMNEKGLAANLLWLSDSVYPKWKGKESGLSVAIWTQYMLDNFATVTEAVQAMEKKNFEIFSFIIPGDTEMAGLHLSISDETGDNAIFEYINGKMVIHHNRSYQVMTNSPVFEEQLALNKYWKKIGGGIFLPGTIRPEDRFIRASYYVNLLPKEMDIRTAIAGIFSVIRNVSSPYSVNASDEPTIWRTVSDQKNKVYYFESAFSPNIFWIDFKNVDFSEKAAIKKLNLVDGQVYSGNAIENFISAKPFIFFELD